MQATFVICFHSARLDNLLQTLRFLTQDHIDVVEQSEIITICQDVLPSDKIHEIEKIGLKSKSWRFVQMDLDEMRLPKMTNFGVSCAKSDKVIILESDRILPEPYFARVINSLRPKISISTQFMRKMLAPYSDEQIRSGEHEGKQEYRSLTNEIGQRNMWSGNTAIWKADFMEADMMDENYIGYGWADSDMCNKMKEIGVENIWLDDLEYHLWHPPATYGSSDQKELFLSNGIRFCQKWNVPKPDWLLQEIAEHRKSKIFM